MEQILYSTDPEKCLIDIQDFAKELVGQYSLDHLNNERDLLSLEELRTIADQVNVEIANRYSSTNPRGLNSKMRADARLMTYAIVYVRNTEQFLYLSQSYNGRGDLELECHLRERSDDVVKLHQVMLLEKIRGDRKREKQKREREKSGDRGGDISRVTCVIRDAFNDSANKERVRGLEEDKREKPEEVWRGIQSFAKKLVQQYLEQSPSGTLSLEQLTEIQNEVNQAIQARYPMTEFEQRKYGELRLKGRQSNKLVGLYIEGDIILYLEMKDFGSFKMMECNLTKNETGRAIIQIITARA